MNSGFDYRDFLQVFAAWDAAYRAEQAAVERLYCAKLQHPADERRVARLLAELTEKRSASDELLALLAAQFDQHGPSVGVL
jgi:hypothetical protein